MASEKSSRDGILKVEQGGLETWNIKMTLVGLSAVLCGEIRQ